jgi:hypothetical protein
MHPSIEFWLPGLHPESEYAKRVQLLVDKALSGIGLSQTAIERIVVTDYTRYAQAIDALGGKTGFTQTADYTGVAKAIPLVRNGKYVATNLLFHHLVIDSFLRESDAEFSESFLEHMRYGFYHEFGHCVDFSRRIAQHAWEPPAKGSSHYRYCATYNSHTLLGEYAATYFSSRFMSEIGFREEMRSTGEALSSRWKPLQAARERVDHAAIEDGLDFFWNGLVEVAKLVALAHGNPALRIDSAWSFWPGNNPQARSVLDRFAESAKVAWQSYPDCASQFEQLVSNTWFSLTSAERFCYEVRNEGDCFYYRPP